MLVRLIAARWCGLVAVLVAALLVPASPVGAVAGFGDVDSDRYFADAVQWSVDNGITGIDGSCFSPDKPVTRGETAVWIWRMQDRPQAPAHSFVDVVAAEQQQPVAWMVSEGVTTGTSDSTFSPDRVLNRVEAAAFLWRLAGRPDAAAHSFVDVLSGWQQGPVSWMASRGITTGTSPTMFSPDGTLTRAQLITFLYRYNDRPTVTIDPDSPACRPTEQEPQVSVALSFGAGPYSATEGESTEVELVLSAALQQPASIPITASGSGGADSADYFVPSSVTVPSGVTSHTFTVVAYSDTAADAGEGLLLGFGALPEGVVTGDATTSAVQITDRPISDAVLDSAINIPDPNFKAALQKLFRKSATQEITVRDARSINTLNISYLEISDLTGIENFVNLVSINVSGNVLSELLVPLLPKLTELEAGGNQLTSVLLETSKLPVLDTLDLSGNQFVEMELDGFTELNRVDLQDNAVETLVLRDLPKIININVRDASKGLVGVANGIVAVSGNPLRSFSFTAVNLPALNIISLNLHGRVLESFVLEDVSNLFYLGIHNAVLSELVLPHLPRLHELWVGTSQLTSISLDPSKLPRLGFLIMVENHIVEMELDGFANLGTYLHDNVIETLVLRDLPQLSSINNSGGPPITNSVTLIGNSVKRFIAVNLPKLWILALISQGLESILLEDVPKLSNIILYDNMLTSVVLDSERLPALQFLSLSNNQLVELELGGFTELNRVNLQDNALETLVLRDLPKITTVYKDENFMPEKGMLGWVNLVGNPGVEVFSDFLEDSSGGSGGPVEMIAVPWRPRDLRVEDVGVGVGGRRSFIARWGAPVRESDSAIEGYTVTVSHRRVSPSVAAWSHSYEVTDRSFRFDHGDLGYTYKVSVRARNSSGNGPAASQEVALRCVSGDKYRINREGGVDLGWLGTHGDHSRIYALQDFKLVPNGWEIKQGYKGGVVFDAGSLSQDGCAWIYQDAAVEGNGKVSGNAVLVNQARVKDYARVSGNTVISDDAKVSDFATVAGNARISGNAEVYNNAWIYDDARVSVRAKIYDRARVYGNARVSGEAEVYDRAWVYGNAQVSGQAKVHGHARVYGNAVLSANDEVSCESYGHESCNHNGELEYEYGAKQLQQNLYDSLYNDFLECGVTSAHAKGSTNDILYPKGTPSSEHYSQIALGHLAFCGRLKVYQDIIQRFTPGPIEFILQWGFVAGSALKLGTFGASLLELLKGIDDISTLIETRRDLDDILKAAHQMLRTK